VSANETSQAEDVVKSSSNARRPLIGQILLRTTQLLRRSNSLGLLGDIEHNAKLSPPDVQTMQFERLTALLKHAETNVPYYREVFHSLGIQAGDIRTLTDFAALPILTKDIIRERGADLIRQDVSKETLLAHHSGGSTGVPLTFYRERNYVDASEAGTFRNWMASGWEPGEMVAFFWGSSERLAQMSRWQFRLRQELRRTYQFDPFRSGTTDMDEWLNIWPSLHPRIAHGYASTIARFAEHIEKSGKSVEALRGVFSTAEKLFPKQREIISRVFRCHVFDCYGSSEVQNISAECRAGRMHVNADFVVLEQEGTGATPFLVTSLWNYAMPFIRYRNEDCGELLDGSCDCGNNFPLMKLNITRVSDNFLLPGGRVVHGEFFTHLMYGSEGIANFQFHQTAINAITLWIVPGPGKVEKRAATAKAAVEQIKALTSEPLLVDVKETEAIPLSSAGKHRFTRSDVSKS